MIFEDHEMWYRFFRYGHGKGGRFYLPFDHEGKRKHLYYKTKPKCIYADDYEVDNGFLRIAYYLKDKFYFCAIYPEYQWRGAEHKWRMEPAWSSYKLFGDTTLGDVDDLMFIIALTMKRTANPLLK